MTTALAPERRRAKSTYLASKDDAGLVRCYVEGQDEAFDELVERYQARLLNFIYRIMGDRDRAEDLVQETFLRVHRHIRRFDASKKFSTWIYTISSNLAKNELRNRSRNPIVLFQALKAKFDDEDRPLQFVDPSPGPERLFDRNRLRALVEQSVAKLPILHREVFVLREFEGRSYEEIATITGAHMGTVKSRLSRSRRALASIVRPEIE